MHRYDGGWAGPSRFSTARSATTTTETLSRRGCRGGTDALDQLGREPYPVIDLKFDLHRENGFAELGGRSPMREKTFKVYRRSMLSVGLGCCRKPHRQSVRDPELSPGNPEPHSGGRRPADPRRSIGSCWWRCRGTRLRRDRVAVAIGARIGVLPNAFRLPFRRGPVQHKVGTWAGWTFRCRDRCSERCVANTFRLPRRKPGRRKGPARGQTFVFGWISCCESSPAARPAATPTWMVVASVARVTVVISAVVTIPVVPQAC